MLLEEFFKLNPNIDINSKNKNGDTIILKAIRENNYKILHKLIIYFSFKKINLYFFLLHFL